MGLPNISTLFKLILYILKILWGVYMYPGHVVEFLTSFISVSLFNLSRLLVLTENFTLQENFWCDL